MLGSKVGCQFNAGFGTRFDGYPQKILLPIIGFYLLHFICQCNTCILNTYGVKPNTESNIKK
jgi:hypothetical protein